MKTEIEVAVKEGIGEMAVNLTDQEARAVIDSDESLSKGADLAKIIRAQIKKADDQRKEYVGPLNEVVKRINADFKRMVAPLQKASDSLKGKMNAYVREKERREAEERRRLAREAEERALREAEKLEKAGRQQEAEEALVVGSAAQDVAAQRRSAPVRGDYGAVASARKTWDFEVDDLNQVPLAYMSLDERKVRDTIRESAGYYRLEGQKMDLKGRALDVHVERRMETFSIPGLKIVQTVSAVVR